MARFYVDPSQISGKQICLMDNDYNHVCNVLRMQIGDLLTVCDGTGTEYVCRVAEYRNAQVILAIEEQTESNLELPVQIYLFQGLPKKDKMELIIQKSIELGVHKVVPVLCRRTIVKIEDAKKEGKKTERWRAIAEGAAKQCHRGYVPEVTAPMSFSEAIHYAKEHCDTILFPYENAEGMRATKEAIAAALQGKSIGIFIGPEGGFDREEVEAAIAAKARVISLGRRILRTETAGLAILSILMYDSELKHEE